VIGALDRARAGTLRAATVDSTRVFGPPSHQNDRLRKSTVTPSRPKSGVQRNSRHSMPLASAICVLRHGPVAGSAYRDFRLQREECAPSCRDGWDLHLWPAGVRRSRPCLPPGSHIDGTQEPRCGLEYVLLAARPLARRPRINAQATGRRHVRRTPDTSRTPTHVRPVACRWPARVFCGRPARANRNCSAGAHGFAESSVQPAKPGREVPSRWPQLNWTWRGAST
jgi:hypothetical protein